MKLNKISNKGFNNFLKEKVMPEVIDIFTDPHKLKILIDNVITISIKIKDKLDVKDIEVYISLVKDYLQGKYKDIHIKNILLIMIGFVYLVMPFDLVPDVILGLGFLDDVTILGFIFKAINSEIKMYVDFINTPSYKEEETFDIVLAEDIKDNISGQLISLVNEINFDKEIEEINKKLELNNIKEDKETIKNEIKEFFKYNEQDYAALIHNMIFDYNCKEVIITTNDIKKEILNDKSFDKKIAKEVLNNDSLFTMIELKYKNYTKPFRKVKDSDKKINGVYETIFETNENISRQGNIINNSYRKWDIVQEELINNNVLYSKKEIKEKNFDKYLIESIIEDYQEGQILDNIFIYEFKNLEGNITFQLQNKNNKNYININASTYYLENYYNIVNNLEEEMISMLKKKIKNNK